MVRRSLRLILAALFTLTCAGALAAGREEKITNPSPDRTWGSKVGGFFASGKSIGVVIAISNYIGERAGGYPALPTARHDADKMVDFLIKDAGFDTVYLLTDDNATKQKIDQLMTDVIPTLVGPRDRFLFYWSGHGDQRLSLDGRRAFGFLPLANSKSKEFSAMISMQDLERWDRYHDARQALFVLDACLSGLAGVEKKAARDARLEQLSLPAHHLLTAGTANESVISGDRWGGSLFTDSFILGAKGQARGLSGVVSLFSLIDFIQDRVIIEKQAANWTKNLTPQLQSLQAGDGAFFFMPSQQVVGRPSQGEDRRQTSEQKGQPPDTKLSAVPPNVTATAATAPTLLGQYYDWGAYTAWEGSKKVCFALAKPKTAKTEPVGRARDPAYVFISTRPTENVKNEVSILVGYPFKTSSDATVEVGTSKFSMYTKNDGAWVKNVAEEARMVDAMRKSADLTVKGISGRGMASTDRYSLQGLAQALDKIEQECK